MENFITMTKTFWSKRFLLNDFEKLVHHLFILVLGIEQGKWSSDLFCVGEFEKGWVDDSSSFKEFDRVNNLFASPAESIDTS